MDNFGMGVFIGIALNLVMLVISVGLFSKGMIYKARNRLTFADFPRDIQMPFWTATIFMALEVFGGINNGTLMFTGIYFVVYLVLLVIKRADYMVLWNINKTDITPKR